MKLNESYLKQFEMLESRINEIWNSRRNSTHSEYVSLPKYLQWKTQVITLLQQVYPIGLFPKALDAKADSSTNKTTEFQFVVGIFLAAYEDYKNGLLDDLQLRIEGGVACDYLQQAESLMDDKEDVGHSYIPAAVLTGAVLEKSLRTLCEKHEPPIDINNESGKPKKAQRMVDDLKKVGIFTPIEAKQVEAWLAIRNAAAHGKDDEFTRSDVASMIRGVTDFLAKHIGQ